MKKIFMLVSLAILVSGAGLSHAQVDEMMGLYFDDTVLYNCIDTWDVTPYTTIPLYLVLVNPTFPELYGFEAGLTMDGPAILLSAIIEINNYIDIGIPGNHIVGFATPTIMMQSNLLATFTFLYTNTTNEAVCFKLHGSSPSSIDPLYPTVLLADSVMRMPGTDLIVDDCSAIISDQYCYVTATEETTWGTLKTLYR